MIVFFWAFGNGMNRISLKEEIQNKLSKDYSKFLLTLMETDRPEEQAISKEDAYNFAKDLIDNEIKQFATMSISLKRTKPPVWRLPSSYS